MVRDLSITVDYYNVYVDNLVSTIGVPAILAGCYPGAGGTPNQAYCNLITRAPSSGRILFVTDVNQNIGNMRTYGVDFAVRYALPTSVGRFGFGLDGTWLGYYTRQGITGVGTYDLGALPIWKGNVGANWRFAGFSVAALLRYVGTFKECAASDNTSSGGLCYAAPDLPARQVGHNTVVDLNAGYTLLSSIGRTVFMLGVNNVFDEAPQYVYSAALANSDPSVYDYVGRYIYTRIQHTF
jgi:iron complex outermembrane receptor protein